MATTPPPPTNLRTPPTPRHGAGYEGYDPYVTRHSSRIASRRAAAKSHTTPLPSSPTLLQAQTDKATEGGFERKPSAMGALSPPSSTQNSPRKRPGGRVKVAPDSLSMSNERHIPSQTHTSPHTTQNKNSITHNNRARMEEFLPTPVKTPRKKMVPDSNLDPRVLFPNKSSAVPENTHNPKSVKKGKKFSAFSLESFNENGGSETQDTLQIFTDSRDRIPELDESDDNPFYQKPDVANGSEVNRTTKRRKVDDNVKRDPEVQKALHREDGMYYVFRGKKIFKKFAGDSEDDGHDDDQGLLAGRSDSDSLASRNVRPLTRASIKPRLLFPTAEQREAREAKAVFTDEEATTDIEEHADAEEVVDAPGNEAVMDPEPTTPTDQTASSTAATPPSPKYPGRSLRSQSKIDAQTTPSNGEKANASFDIWQRTKSSSDGSATSTPKARKRGVSSTDRSGGPVKKKVRGK